MLDGAPVVTIPDASGNEHVWTFLGCRDIPDYDYNAVAHFGVWDALDRKFKFTHTKIYTDYPAIKAKFYSPERFILGVRLTEVLKLLLQLETLMVLHVDFYPERT